MNDWLHKITGGLPHLNYQIWILIVGRSLSQLGTGFILFYAPLFFVHQVGLSASVVGIGLGSSSLAGAVGRVVGGSLADSPRWGRRPVLLLSAAVSAIADAVLALAYDAPLFLLGNVLMGIGIGLYWPATEAVVADLSTQSQRNEAFALTRLGDSVGLGLGVVLGGALISTTHAYRSLFIVDGLSFLIFLAIVYWAIAETRNPAQPHYSILSGWKIALGDRLLMVYVIVNTLFTTYLAIVNSALPLYFSSFVPVAEGKTGFSTSTISALVSWHVLLAALTQLPVARAVNAIDRIYVLLLSAGSWGIGFGLIWLTGKADIAHLLWAALGLSVMAIATVLYTPVASALVVDLAPPSLRGIYLSVNSLCWAGGYFIGPTVGGWAMDQGRAIADGFWVVSALSVAGAIGILLYLKRLQKQRQRSKSAD